MRFGNTHRLVRLHRMDKVVREMKFRFGDYVVYQPGFKPAEIGRVTECGDTSAFVCFSHGCTAASTPLKFLRPATGLEIMNADGKIGYHRFDELCPDRDEDACFMCRARKGYANV